MPKQGIATENWFRNWGDEVFSQLYRLMGMMVLLMGTGFLMRKRGLISAEGKKNLTDIILYAILPCNIIKAFSQKMDDGIWKRFFLVLLMAVVAQAVSFLLSRVLYRNFEASEQPVYQYATVCSNSGFMGNPLAEGVFGDTGLLFASIFLIPQRIVMWTAGVSCFQKEENGKTAYKKILVHPCMIATYIGLVIMVFQIQLPGIVSDTVLAFSNCCTALTMVYIGTILVDVDFRQLVDKQQIYFAVVRLAFIPLVVFGVCRLAGVDALITGVCTLLSATPAGSTTSLLAAKYGADEQAAARCVVFTTALSAITIPVWSMFLLLL